MNLKTLARKTRLAVRYGAKLSRERQSEWQRGSNGYRCRLSYQGRKIFFDFWQGVGISRDPDRQSVLDCLLSDAQAGDQSFHDFCNDFGYDEDSREAYRTWKACQHMAAKMRELLGADFDAFLYADRN